MLIPRKKGHQKNMGKINNKFVGFKILALGRLYYVCDICFFDGGGKFKVRPGWQTL